MLTNYFKVAWRNIIKTKGYSALNIFGLAIGMAVALIIGLWVFYQHSYDRFLPNNKQLYRVQRNFFSNGDTLTFASTSLKLAQTLRSEIPEIEYVAESDWMGPHGLMVGTKKLYMEGSITGTDFLKMFQFPFLQGNATTAFADPYSIVLTESTAKALFGDEDPINKTVRFDNKNELKVTAILKDLPAASTFQFKFLVPFSYLSQNGGLMDAYGSFGNNSWQQFVQLKAGISYAQVAPKIRNIEHTENGINPMSSYVILQPLRNWHLYGNYVNGKETGGYIEYVRMFSIVGLLVLLIACINFINLITAGSQKRAKEVGIRKAIGSKRKELIVQFLMESFLLTAIALLFALVIVQLALPYFNSLAATAISIPFSNPAFWAGMLLFLITTAVLAGSRPAFYLSSFNPVKVLKGTMQLGRLATLPRKALVVLQFSCSVALIISTAIIYQQIQHAKNRPTGYDINRLMMTNMSDDLNHNYTALKDELMASGLVTNVTTATSPATDIYWHADIANWPGKNAGETVEMGMIGVTKDYFSTLGMTIKEGTDFSGDKDSTSVLMNEAAIKRLRLKDPVNKMMTIDGTQVVIRGVVKDALMLSPFAPADPTLFFCRQDGPGGNLMYRLSPFVPTQDAIAKLTTIFNKYNKAYPYKYQFADDSYAAKFNVEVLIGRLAGIFTGLAIFISCLGLFGLSAYTAKQKTKEIGVRKVLGASIPQMWLMLSKDFILLVVISCLIASPVALYFLSHWLQQYQYRINIGAGVFIVSAMMAILITVITVSFQAIKAAVLNPVKSLRSE